MRIDIITLFPESIEAYCKSSIIGRAQKNKLIQVKIHHLRDFSPDKKYHRVDDRQYGGGPGMVLQLGPLVRAIVKIKRRAQKKRSKIILFSAGGALFDSERALSFAKRCDHLILIAGHYEGVDDRIKKIFSMEEISVGPYVLTGGELPALIVIDAVTRHIKGVLGDPESLEEKRFGVGVPVYTRPDVFVHKKKRYAVPSVLLSGNHAEIEKWRLEHKQK